MSHQHPTVPVGGPILTRPFLILLGLGAAGLLTILVRFVLGLGSVTALSDGYPWGLWIAFDVVTGTALASGGYAIALLVYIMNRGRYHPLVRPAMLTSALGYTMALIGVFIDLGRYWGVYNMAFLWHWNVNSVLLEVAVCVMAYSLVLWIELSPALLEGWRNSSRPLLRRLSRVGLPVVEKALLWVLAFGILLPTMHQSSLGSLLLVATHKLHPLWHTPLLPLLFLLSALAMGYAAVVFESALSSAAFRRPRETRLLAQLSKIMVLPLLLYVVARVADLVLRGRLGLILALDVNSVLFLSEIALVLIPVLILLSAKRRADPGHLFRAAMLLMLGGSLYRFDAFLVAFRPGPQWSYFPSVPELLVTLGLVALEIAAYIAIVKRFPVLRAAVPTVPAVTAGANA
jgi:Ni/Fe-hydrogenase subunit HybB-like protein